MNINDILIEPIITEKSSSKMSENVYTFKVHPKATKPEIKKAVESIFAKSEAKVSSVNIIKMKRKFKRMGKYEGYKSGYKKALVKLSKGSIPIYGSQGIENLAKTDKKSLNVINTEKIMEEVSKGK